MSSTIVSCDQCKQDFSISMESRRLDFTIDLHYFSCPHCGHEYPSYYTDTAVRGEQRKVKDSWQRFRSIKDIAKREKIHADILVRQKRISSMIDELKEKMCAGSG
ncbi:hypothetical protein J31TS4_19300 [Paenibacillus sp. J31TS4]|uniref:hypothetical protein n=1 Tax=Paenibacillus sp. J31TS4 TaxID=2807195 RepID=UPI001B15F38A|nr:hypothetical protein [Paenibacillus sp. J31TS4]GIP38650.1 hypothetical protein J31TS4_19300 [Paenibacillus sp. J31TS4]